MVRQYVIEHPDGTVSTVKRIRKRGPFARGFWLAVSWVLLAGLVGVVWSTVITGVLLACRRRLHDDHSPEA